MSYPPRQLPTKYFQRWRTLLLCSVCKQVFPLRHHHEINLAFLFNYKDRIFQSKASYLFKMLFFEKCVSFCTFASLALSCIPKPFMLWTKALVTQNNIKEKSVSKVLLDQDLGRLVLVSSIHCCTSTSSLSTWSSSRGLTSFEWDILS